MAWFRKEKKPRQPRRERLEIPPDAWEKCEACQHTDLREKFIKNLNVCPNCDYHRRIRANAISPGAIRTDLADCALDKYPEFAELLASQTALGRVGEPEDVGRMIASLLSDDNAWVNAQTIEVGGGYMV